jgi:DNA invertase Pin-like site-specific DNA recombinase
MRAAIYARFSTDRQREASIEDQFATCRARARSEGWEVVATFSDAATSGSTPPALRPGGKALLAAVLAGRVDVILVEGLDRISREIGEAEAVVKRIEHRGVRIIGTSDGYDSNARGRKVMRIARGLVNELYLDDLRAKTHRGLAGNIERGMSAGGRSYGYRTEAAVGGRRLVIDPGEAAIVREAFERYAGGETPRAIAHDLNRRGIPTARGGTWGVGGIQGSAARGLGLVHNRLYVGEVVWNRRQWVKDPDSGLRRYVERPREEWRTRIDEGLRIIDDALWRAVQARAGAAPRGTRRGPGAAPRTLFGGLLRCAECGGAFIAISATRYGCLTRKDRGPAACSNRGTVSREVVDRRLIAELRAELDAPAAWAKAQAAAKRLASGGRPAESLRDIEAEIGRLVEAIATVGVSEALAGRLRAAEARRDELARAAQPAPPVDALAARYRRALLRLKEVLEGGDRARTRAILAEALGPIVIRHEPGGVFAEFEDPGSRLMLAAGSLEGVAGAHNHRRRLRLR